jgi:hypothetical protein
MHLPQAIAQNLTAIVTLALFHEDWRSQPFCRGMRHTSTALYFYEASKKSLHMPRATSENMLFHISYGLNYYLQLLCLQFLSKTCLNL